jgi:hypothetical protein
MPSSFTASRTPTRCGCGRRRLIEKKPFKLVAVALAFLLIADVEGPRNGFVQVEPVNLDDVATAMSQK